MELAVIATWRAEYFLIVVPIFKAYRVARNNYLSLNNRPLISPGAPPEYAICCNYN